MPRFSETVIEHFQNPLHRGPLKNPDRVGLVGSPGGGPFFLLALKLDKDRILEAKFECHGCGASIATGSILTEALIGIDLDTAANLTTGDLFDALGGMPADKQHCLENAIHALRLALGDSKRDAASQEVSA